MRGTGADDDVVEREMRAPERASGGDGQLPFERTWETLPRLDGPWRFHSLQQQQQPAESMRTRRKAAALTASQHHHRAEATRSGLHAQLQRGGVSTASTRQSNAYTAQLDYQPTPHRQNTHYSRIRRRWPRASTPSAASTLHRAMCWPPGRCILVEAQLQLARRYLSD